MKNKASYFLSDFHLGVPNHKDSLSREKRIISFLDQIKSEAKAIYFLGDVFDFWFEWEHVVPKGYVRFLAKVAELVESGIEIHFFKGNHDMWQFGYLENELGIKLHSDQLELKIDGEYFYLHHGDGLEKQDRFYRFIKKIFRSSFFQWLFARLHPNTSMSIAMYFSKTSRKKNQKKQTPSNTNDEWLYQFAKKHYEMNTKIDYYIFGHRHIPMQLELSNDCQYVNIGDWLQHFSFAKYTNKKIELLEHSS